MRTEQAFKVLKVQLFISFLSPPLPYFRGKIRDFYELRNSIVRIYSVYSRNLIHLTRQLMYEVAVIL